METLQIMDIARDAIYTLIKISLPLMMVALGVGLVISLFQALTQIQEMTLSFVPKILAIFFAAVMLMPYINNEMIALHERLTDYIINIK